VLNPNLAVIDRNSTVLYKYRRKRPVDQLDRGCRGCGASLPVLIDTLSIEIIRKLSDTLKMIFLALFHGF
jgi:hypothetical protein